MLAKSRVQRCSGRRAIVAVALTQTLTWLTLEVRLPRTKQNTMGKQQGRREHTCIKRHKLTCRPSFKCRQLQFTLQCPPDRVIAVLPSRRNTYYA